MEATQLKKLKSDLLKFQVESIGASNSDSLEGATQIIITAINKQLEKPTVAKKSSIVSIISLLDSGNIAEIKASFSKINYIELEKVIFSNMRAQKLKNI